MSPVTLHDISTCPASVRRGGRFSHASSAAPRRFFGALARNLLRAVVSAAVPTDGAQWVDTGDNRSQVGVAVADRTKRRRKADVASERLAVRWANWR
jgi:hypothetical protein